MNKARLTYRLDPEGTKRQIGQQKEPEAHPERKIVPLHQEEYHVVEGGEPTARSARPIDGEPVGGRIPEPYWRERQPASERQPAERYGTDPQTMEPARTERPSRRLSYDYGEWESPYDAETRRIEQLIRESGSVSVDPRRDEVRSEAAPVLHAGQNGYDGDTGYYPAYDSDYREPVRWSVAEEPGTKYVKRIHTPWLRITASVTGAVVIGALLGFFVLSLFSGQKPADWFGRGSGDPAAKSQTGVGDAAVDGSAAGASGTEKEQSGAVKSDKAVSAAESGSAAVAAVIPARTYYVLQNGGFSTRQAADHAAGLLRDGGWAAATDPGDKFFVYAGISTSRDSAKLLGQQLKDSKFDIYVKNFDLPAMSKIRWSGKADALSAYLSQSDALVKMISGLSLAHLDELQATPLDAATLQSVNQAYDAWIASHDKAAGTASEDVKPYLQSMRASMDGAKASVEDYGKAPATGKLWQAQSGLLEFIVSEKTLLSDISADK